MAQFCSKNYLKARYYLRYKIDKIYNYSCAFEKSKFVLCGLSPPSAGKKLQEFILFKLNHYNFPPAKSRGKTKMPLSQKAFTISIAPPIGGAIIAEI
ncbi:MAG: hypothetical protein LBR79_03320 [Oscillospiraceae bacterium]|nr:hypothetical protein [Oscillospiraceae bacterium]